MKKSIVVFLLIIQIFLLFIFENLYSLFKEFALQEVAQIKSQCELKADLLLNKFGLDIKKMRNTGYFDNIEFSRELKPAHYSLQTNGSQIYTLRIPVSSSKSMVFHKEIESSLLVSIIRLRKIFLGLTISMGIFIFVTGFYLIFVFKKLKKEEKLKGIPPLQKYLLELKDSEAELKDIVESQQKRVFKKEELNRNIINNINAAVIFLNNSKKIDIFNAVAEKLFSQSFANAKNNELGKILSKFPELVQFVYKNENKKTSADISSNDKEFLVDLIPIKDIGELIIIKDVTQEKLIAEINRRNKNFIMLGEMTIFLTHEIRNSLGVIYGYLKMLQTEEKEKSARSDKVSKINKEINFLSAMMESYLNFSKPIKVEKSKKIDLLELMKKLAQEIDINCRFRGKSIFLESDSALLKSIFSNLILNAKEAGATDIEIVLKDRNFFEIIIKDNGRGIDKGIKEKIWLPFFTTKQKGTGMGLALVRKIVNFLNGEVLLLKSDEKGTTFKIIFY